MFIDMYIYIGIYMYVYNYIYIYMYVYKYMYIYRYMYVCMYVYLYLYVCTQIRVGYWIPFPFWGSRVQDESLLRGLSLSFFSLRRSHHSIFVSWTVAHVSSS